MHNFLSTALPHIFFVIVIFSIPSDIALYVFTALYTFGIFINYKKDQKYAQELLDKNNSDNHSNWWEILGTKETASLSECARVRKLLTKIYHPDGGQAPNAEHMRRINDAFEDAEEALTNQGIPIGSFGHID